MGPIRTTHGGIEESLKIFTRALEKSSNPSFPLSEASTEMFMPNPSAVNGLLQIQHLYGIRMNSYLGQPPPLSLYARPVTLNMVGQSRYDLGPFGPTVDHPLPHVRLSSAELSPQHDMSVVQSMIVTSKILF